MKKALSWKVLAVLAVGFLIISKVVGGVVGDSLMILVVILAALAVVNVFTSKKDKEVL